MCKWGRTPKGGEKQEDLENARKFGSLKKGTYLSVHPIIPHCQAFLSLHMKCIYRARL
jgi:hypothetical protein